MSERQEHPTKLLDGQLHAFVARLRLLDLGEMARLAFEFLIPRAARTREVLGAE